MRRRSLHLGGSSLVLAAVCVVAIGCSSSSGTATPTGASSLPSISSTSSPPQTRRPDETEGAFVFRTQCAGCHGPKGEGNLGPALVGIGDRMTEADQVTLVRAGKDRMPPFSPGLSDEDVKAVVAYT